MITPAEIARAVYGAYRLARSDPAGMDYFDKTPDGFWRSFTAAFLLAPFYALLIAIDYSDLDAAVDPWRYGLVQTIGYATAWVAFPFAMLALSRIIDREKQFVGYICAYNWSAIIQNTVILPVAFLHAGGLATPGIA
ncbi:MAG: hypothetical protein OQK23_07180, partial [Rhodospirillales bacterium]|nr:hypothetical protein [Rhodospirillales bacterium]